MILTSDEWIGMECVVMERKSLVLSGIGEGVVCVWDGVVLGREWFVFGMVWYLGGSGLCMGWCGIGEGVVCVWDGMVLGRE